MGRCLICQEENAVFDLIPSTPYSRDLYEYNVSHTVRCIMEVYRKTMPFNCTNQILGGFTLPDGGGGPSACIDQMSVQDIEVDNRVVKDWILKPYAEIPLHFCPFEASNELKVQTEIVRINELQRRVARLLIN